MDEREAIVAWMRKITMMNAAEPAPVNPTELALRTGGVQAALQLAQLIEDGAHLELRDRDG